MMTHLTSAEASASLNVSCETPGISSSRLEVYNTQHSNANSGVQSVCVCVCVFVCVCDAEISPRGTATRNGRQSADLPVVPEQPEPFYVCVAGELCKLARVTGPEFPHPFSPVRRCLPATGRCRAVRYKRQCLPGFCTMC